MSNLDFHTLFASGRQGWADLELEGTRKDLSPLFDLILSHVPAPKVDLEKPFAMNASILEERQFPGPHPDRARGTRCCAA
jgi:GTP-binding protein